MPYTCRDAAGTITSVHREATPEAVEFLPDDHAELRAFLGLQPKVSATEQFARLDAEFVRVLEDVIDTLINRNLINITTSPPSAVWFSHSRSALRGCQA